MKRVKLTSKYVSDLPYETKQRLVYDAQLCGFGVRIGASKKAYFAEARVAGKTRRVTIGANTILTAEAARKEAQKLLGTMVSGIDPNSAKSEARAKKITLEIASAVFFEHRKLKPNTVYNYRRILSRDFGDWGKKQLPDITPQMICLTSAPMGPTSLI